MARTTTKWVRVTRAEPCAVCGRPDWCGRSADGTVARCTRVESGKKSSGRDGTVAWIHRLSEPLPVVTPKEKSPPVGKAEWAKRVQQMFSHPQAADKREQLSMLLGVSVASLEALEVGVGFDYSGEWFWSFPERDCRWCPVGIKRRYPNGDKKHMVGAKPGLSMAREWWVNPGPVFLPEGGSDVAALLTMGLCAVGRPSNTGGVNSLIGLLRDVDHKPVIVLGENDRKPERVGVNAKESKDDSGVRLCSRKFNGCAWCWPGKYGADAAAERLTNALGRTVYMRMVRDAKDSREWLAMFGVDGYAFVKSLKVPAKWLQSVEVLK